MTSAEKLPTKDSNGQGVTVSDWKEFEAIYGFVAADFYGWAYDNKPTIKKMFKPHVRCSVMIHSIIHIPIVRATVVEWKLLGEPKNE